MNNRKDFHRDYTSKIAVGMTHEAVDTVTDANTALTVGSGTGGNLEHKKFK